MSKTWKEFQLEELEVASEYFKDSLENQKLVARALDMKGLGIWGTVTVISGIAIPSIISMDIEPNFLWGLVGVAAIFILNLLFLYILLKPRDLLTEDNPKGYREEFAGKDKQYILATLLNRIECDYEWHEDIVEDKGTTLQFIICASGLQVIFLFSWILVVVLWT